MKRFLFFILATMSCQLLIGQQIGQTTQGLSVLENGLWPNRTCAVCWENSSDMNSAERGWVRDAVASTWERESEFRFTGWEACTAGSRGIRIFIDDIGPYASALGAKLDGMRNGVTLNFTFNNWPACEGDCRCKDTPEGRKECIQIIAVHEFGHALGFAHEQNRNDAPKDCQKDAQGDDGDWWVTAYDEQSIMNYCNPDWNNEGMLSDQDKVGLNLLYGGVFLKEPIIYGTNTTGDLLWYKHLGYPLGTFDWAPNIGSKVGHGWGEFVHVFSDGEGFMYGIQPNGDLLWFNHNGYREGTFNWSQASGNKVDSGWNSDIKAAFAGGEGVIYMVKTNGDLLWYKHLGYRSGSDSWHANSGTLVGNGWTNFYAAFSGGQGVIYLIDNIGNLFWYKNSGFATGIGSWYGGETNKIGEGWRMAKQVFSTGWGRIYLTSADGKLRYYHHLGFINGTATWGTGTGNQVGNGWDALKTIGMGSINPSVYSREGALMQSLPAVLHKRILDN